MKRNRLRKEKWTRTGVIVALTGALLGTPFEGSLGGLSAYALDRDTRAVLVASAWGVAAGSVLGAAGWAVSGQSKTLFQGSSVGLYFGIGLGLYHITHRDDPSNPLRLPPEEKLRSEYPSVERALMQAVPPPLIHAQVTVYQF